MLDAMDAEFGVDTLIQEEKQKKQKATIRKQQQKAQCSFSLFSLLLSMSISPNLYKFLVNDGTEFFLKKFSYTN